MSRVLIDLAYLPCIAWWAAVGAHDEVTLEQHEHYVKQSFRNRCIVVTASGLHELVIPINHTGAKQKMKDVRMSGGARWRNTHWRTILSAYHKAPYFEHYGDDLHNALFQPTQFLFDFDEALVRLGQRWLGIVAHLGRTQQFAEEAAAAEDLRGMFRPKGSSLLTQDAPGLAYHQVFGAYRLPGISFIDLLFNAGPEARGHLTRLPAHIGTT